MPREPDHTFYTNAKPSGIIPPKLESIDAYNKEIENQQKALDALYKQQYTFMLNNDETGMSALDNSIKKAEQDIGALKTQLGQVMGADMRGQRGNQLTQGDVSPLVYKMRDEEQKTYDFGMTPFENKSGTVYDNDLVKPLSVSEPKADKGLEDEEKAAVNWYDNAGRKQQHKEQMRQWFEQNENTNRYDETIPTTPPDVSDPTSSVYTQHPEFWDLYLKASDNYANKLDAKHEIDGKPLKVNSLKNFENVLAGVGMKEGDNYLVEYAKSFVGELPYVKAGRDLAMGADCSGFVYSVFKDFGIEIGYSTSSLSRKAEEMKDVFDENYISTPWLNSSGEYIPFEGTIGEAYKAVDDFCAGLKPGDLILFDLGSSHDKPYKNQKGEDEEVFGHSDHVVMYAGNGMIVHEHEPGRNAEYHPITELIFNRAGNNPAGDKTYEGNYDWQKRMPIFALGFLSEEDEQKFTYK